MAKLYFYYSAMNAGKSTTLLQSAHNYEERGMSVLIFTPMLDSLEHGHVHSRIGLTREAIMFDAAFDFYDFISVQRQSSPKLACILIDEAHFLSKQHVMQLTDVVDGLDIPVLAFGLRSDFRGEAFPGSLSLLVWADHLVELKTICFCGRKAIMSARLDDQGNTVKEGDQVLIGGNERYVALCRKHFKNEPSSG